MLERITRRSQKALQITLSIFGAAIVPCNQKRIGCAI